MADHGLTGIKPVVRGVVERTLAPVLPKPEEPKIKRSEFYTGAIVRGSENSLGQATRAEYINEFIEFWTLDYRSKAKCLSFLAIALLTFNVLAPFALFCVALAAKYWDMAMWNRNISRFNGNFRTIIFAQ